MQLVVGTVVSLLWFRAAFSLANKPERFLQTSVAMFGTTTLFMPALIPMIATLLPYIEKPDPAVNPPAALSLLAAVARDLAADRAGAHRARRVRVALDSPRSSSSSA